jgi:signal transduction histidine kinase
MRPCRPAQPPSRIILIALVSGFYGATLVLGLAALLTRPQLSLSLNVPTTRQAVVTWVLPGGNLWEQGIRAGDRILALDGQLPSRSQDGSWSGQRLQVRLSNGRVLAVNARTTGRVAETWPLVLLSPWFFLLGVLVHLRAPRRDVGFAAYCLFAASAFALVLAPATDRNQVVASVAEHIALPIFAAYFALFFLTFPVRRGSAYLRAALFVPPVLVSMLAIIEIIWPVVYALSAALRLAILLLYLLIGTGLMVGSFMTVPDNDARRGLTIMAAGTVCSIATFVALYLVPTLLGRSPLLTAEHAILALALLPASFTYAILRHNTFNVPLVQRWLVHGLLLSLLIALYIGTAFAMRLALVRTTLPIEGSIVVAALFALLAGMSFRWLFDRIRQQLDYRLFKDSYNYRASLQRLSQELSLAGDLDVLGASLASTLRQLMNLEFALLLVRDEQGSRACGAAGVWPARLQQALLMAAQEVCEHSEDVVLAEGGRPVLVVPLRIQNMVLGHLCLGPKATGEPFRAEDHALLSTLSGHLAAIVQNADLIDELQLKLATLDSLNERLHRAQEEERARFAAEIHDEPIQTALHLQRRIATDGHNRAAAVQHVALTELLVGQLRAICLAVRPAALDELGLAAALELLALDLGEQSGIPILLDADPLLEDMPLAPVAELVLYRAAQEAVNNALRHARPTEVRSPCNAAMRRCRFALPMMARALPSRPT